MKYSNVLFNKDLYDLEFADIEAFFVTVKEETLNLEFKSYVAQGEYNKKEDAVKKAVCGLLNSEGGIVIWGAPIETKDQQGNTSAVGALTPFSSILDKDRFINILSSTISPLPVGIRIQVLKNNADESIFIIEVEKSLLRPHQYDNKYYIRLDGQTRIAPHYLISALMKSTDFPVIQGHLRLKRIEWDRTNYLLHFKKLLFNTSIYNNEINVHMRLITFLGRIIVNHIDHISSFSQTFPILSNGRPLMSNFIIKIHPNQINENIELVFQFGGEKSPSKISSYKYRISGNIPIGDVPDESIYLYEKSENKLPADDNTVEENINLLLNQ